MSLSIQCHLTRDTESFFYKAHFGRGITGICGASGSGKTTLLNLIAGVLKPKTGTIQLDYRVLVNCKSGVFVPPHKRNIGVVFQEGRLFPHMSVLKNLKYSKPDIIQMDRIIALLDIEDILNAYPEMLSGGEKQRVALGRTLLQQPSVLLLDEPFSALDSTRRYEIIPFLKEIQQLYDIPILVVSHDIEDIMQLTSCITVVEKRAVSWQGTIDQFHYRSVSESSISNAISGINRIPVMNPFYTNM